jgi:putative phosphoesterase
MIKFGIISDTHIDKNFDSKCLKVLISLIKDAFKDVNEIIHAGDVCDEAFLKELRKIAPTKCVRGDMDKNVENLENILECKAGSYNIGVIHKLPENLEKFSKDKKLHILVYGHTHQPEIRGTTYNVLLLNPGSPTKPKAPPQKLGFKKPVARPTVITLKIDEHDLLTTFIINLKI